MVNFESQKTAFICAFSLGIMTYSQNLEIEQRTQSSGNNYGERGFLSTDNGSLRIEAGGSLRVFPGASLTAKSEITNLGTGENVIVENDGNFIQINNAANTGNMLVKKDIEVGAPRTQYNYIGSPVTFAANLTLKNIYDGIDFVLYHVESNSKFFTSTGANIPGRGLAVKEPNLSVIGVGTDGAAMTITANFKGVPQNGDINIGIVNSATTNSSRGYNLVANPYPSNIDLIKLYNINGGNTLANPQIVSANISPTFYFWDNEVNNGVALTQQGSNYSGAAYAVYNALTGNNGTGTAAAGYLSGTPELGGKKPTNIVKVSQGFMVKSLVSNYNFKFNNSIRTGEAAATEFFGRSAQEDRYWLQMISPLNVVNTIAVVHYEGGSNSKGLEDSEVRGGSDELFSVVDGMKAAINGRALFSDTDVIPLGSRHYQAGNYQIRLGEREGRFAAQQVVYLRDNQNGIITNLSEGSAYTFAASEGENMNRFEIIYKPGGVLGAGISTKETFSVYRDQDLFTVQSSAKKITKLELFDSSGRLLYTVTSNSKEMVIDTAGYPSGVYILKIARSGEILSRKIVR